MRPSSRAFISILSLLVPLVAALALASCTGDVPPGTGGADSAAAPPDLQAAGCGGSRAVDVGGPVGGGCMATLTFVCSQNPGTVYKAVCNCPAATCQCLK